MQDIDWERVKSAAAAVGVWFSLLAVPIGAVWAILIKRLNRKDHLKNVELTTKRDAHAELVFQLTKQLEQAIADRDRERTEAENERVAHQETRLLLAQSESRHMEDLRLEAQRFREFQDRVVRRAMDLQAEKRSSSKPPSGATNEKIPHSTSSAIFSAKIPRPGER